MPVQYDYLGYLLVKPQLGLGISASLTYHPPGKIGYEHTGHFKYFDIGIYSKRYLDNERSRLFGDIKLGYGIARDNTIQYCFSCEESNPLYIRYSSGPMIQPGMGVEVATSNFIKWGVSLSGNFKFVTIQNDRNEYDWETTPEGIIKRRTRNTVLGSLFLGFYVYI